MIDILRKASPSILVVFQVYRQEVAARVPGNQQFSLSAGRQKWLTT